VALLKTAVRSDRGVCESPNRARRTGIVIRPGLGRRGCTPFFLLLSFGGSRLTGDSPRDRLTAMPCMRRGAFMAAMDFGPGEDGGSPAEEAPRLTRAWRGPVLGAGRRGRRCALRPSPWPQANGPNEGRHSMKRQTRGGAAAGSRCSGAQPNKPGWGARRRPPGAAARCPPAERVTSGPGRREQTDYVFSNWVGRWAGPSSPSGIKGVYVSTKLVRRCGITMPAGSSSWKADTPRGVGKQAGRQGGHAAGNGPFLEGAGRPSPGCVLGARLTGRLP